MVTVVISASATIPVVLIGVVIRAIIVQRIAAAALDKARPADVPRIVATVTRAIRLPW